RPARSKEDEQRKAGEACPDETVAKDKPRALSPILRGRELRYERLEQEQAGELGRHVGNAIGGQPVTELGRPEMIAVDPSQREQGHRREPECRGDRGRIAQKVPETRRDGPPAQPKTSNER